MAISYISDRITQLTVHSDIYLNLVPATSAFLFQISTILDVLCTCNSCSCIYKLKTSTRFANSNILLVHPCDFSAQFFNLSYLISSATSAFCFEYLLFDSFVHIHVP